MIGAPPYELSQDERISTSMQGGSGRLYRLRHYPQYVVKTQRAKHLKSGERRFYDTLATVRSQGLTQHYPGIEYFAGALYVSDPYKGEIQDGWDTYHEMLVDLYFPFIKDGDIIGYTSPMSSRINEKSGYSRGDLTKLVSNVSNALATMLEFGQLDGMDGRGFLHGDLRDANVAQIKGTPCEFFLIDFGRTYQVPRFLGGWDLRNQRADLVHLIGETTAQGIYGYGREISTLCRHFVKDSRAFTFRSFAAEFENALNVNQSEFVL
jgi:hypothetical protein